MKKHLFPLCDGFIYKPQFDQRPNLLKESSGKRVTDLVARTEIAAVEYAVKIATNDFW